MKKYLLTILILTLSFPIQVFSAGTIANRVSGQILLQVEKNGEAWYVYPKNKNRYYLKNGQAAYDLMKNLGLGITDDNLKKIPIGLISLDNESDLDKDGLSDKIEESIGTKIDNHDSDGDGYSDYQEVKNGADPLGVGAVKYDQNLVSNLKGNILIQVESKGEAWYLNPRDEKRYYMSNGNSAYEIMRKLGLGATDKDIQEITPFIDYEDDKAMARNQIRWADVNFILDIFLKYNIDNEKEILKNLIPNNYYMIGSGPDFTGCNSVETTETFDLSVVANRYSVGIPSDPLHLLDGKGKSYYYIYKNENGRVFIGACEAETVNGIASEIKIGR